MPVRPLLHRRPVRRIFLAPTLAAGLALSACGPSDEELAQTCVADYARAAQTTMDDQANRGFGMSIAATATRSFESVLLVDEAGHADADWSACPGDFTVARDQAIAALPMFKDSMEKLAQGPTANMAEMMALRDALAGFRTAWVIFSEVMLAHLNDPAVAGQLSSTDYAGLETYLERQIDN